ncbi:hypothetical protein [Dyella sp. AtDHG13]|uniref:hypothetical protein n=1 Tax=Dyella sp. AtDHG13 TaxID=1938897 RepID=UPI0011B839A1|nr:hypothetical protein [Dyella sp. AtDHG13]
MLLSLRGSLRTRPIAKRHERENRHHGGRMQASIAMVVEFKKCLKIGIFDAVEISVMHFAIHARSALKL